MVAGADVVAGAAVVVAATVLVVVDTGGSDVAAVDGAGTVLVVAPGPDGGVAASPQATTVSTATARSRAVPTGGEHKVGAGVSMTHLDELLRTYQQHSLHCRRVPAAPEEAVAAARRLAVSDVSGLRLLLGVRALPGLLRGRSPLAAGSLVDLGLRYGFGILVEEPRELAVGLIGQPWRATGGQVVRFGGPDEFTAFDRPGFVKVAAGFRASPAGAGCELCTETRVAATDPGSAGRFARYWTVIAPFGGWLRRRMLAAVARRCAGH